MFFLGHSVYLYSTSHYKITCNVLTLDDLVKQKEKSVFLFLTKRIELKSQTVCCLLESPIIVFYGTVRFIWIF